MVRFYYLFCIVLCLVSCNRVSPEKYIAATTLNSNQVAVAYGPMFFQELMELKAKNRLPDETAVDYVNTRAIQPVTETLERLNSLPETAETKALIDAAREVMRYGTQVFERDYRDIAGLIDTGSTQAEIDAAIDRMYANTADSMQQKFDHLDQVALAYAKEHDVALQIR